MQITKPKSQQERVIAICSDGQYRTLDRIRREIKAKFNKSDTETAREHAKDLIKSAH